MLFGAHCFFIHPIFVAIAWWKLYSFPWDPRLWAAFFINDCGYVFLPNMDGPEGERHVEFGAAVMHALFDRWEVAAVHHPPGDIATGPDRRVEGAFWVLERPTRWRDLCLYHSRFYARRDGVNPSRLCAADKLAVALEPWWLYLPRVIASGEIHEYMALSRAAGDPNSKYRDEPDVVPDSELAGLGPVRAWHKRMTEYCRRWAYAHADGREDTWTPAARPARPDMTEAA